jgi:1,4-dihydroxy-2-naphthoate octaprenyltransferase
VIAIGVASILSGVAYTAGPYPLGYHGLGDVFVFAFFGLVAVCGTAFVQLGQVPALAWLAAVPVGAVATAVLVVNNIRDRETDAVAGKRTLAVRLGRRAAVIEYALLLLAAYAAPLALTLAPARDWAFGGHGGARPLWALLPLATLPAGVRLLRTLATTDGRPLNACPSGTAKLLLAHAALFAAGLVLAAPAPGKAPSAGLGGAAAVSDAP